jgi:hypothetical protein
MSATLDLVGGAHTITADTTETNFTATDTVGGGTLTLEAGSALEFDDTAGAGFLSTSLAFTLTVTGTSTAWATIKSANSYPDNRWTLPPTGITGTTTRCQWRDYTGSFPTGLIRNNPSYVLDAYVYATIDEITNLTGTTLSDDILMEILSQSSRHINNSLATSGITVDQAGDRSLQAICLEKATAALIRRMILDGTRAGSINVDGHASSSELMALINECETRSEQALIAYSKEHLPSTRKRIWAQKVNAHG